MSFLLCLEPLVDMWCLVKFRLGEWGCSFLQISMCLSLFFAAGSLLANLALPDLKLLSSKVICDAFDIHTD